MVRARLLRSSVSNTERNQPMRSTPKIESVSSSGMPNDATAPAPALSKRQVFFRRLISSVALWSLIIAALFSGHKLISDYVFLGVMMLLACAGLWEFYGIVEKRDLVCFKYTGLIGGVLLMVGTFMK